jgi:plasmid stabilization system protein ParE
MLKIIYTKKFQKDLLEIQNFIWEDSVFYSLKVLNNIKSTIEILKNFPKVGMLIENETRFIIENNYKYKIVYELKWKNIYILAVYKYKNSWE